MSVTDDGTDTAASRLHELHEFFRTHPVTGPTERHTATVRPGTPINLGMLDHIRRTVTEVVDHTYAVNPEAGPFPQHVADVYQWCRENTQHADDAQALSTRILEIRHRLEHAVRAGDTKVVRPHRCPACGTVGLLWQAGIGRAMCANVHCARRNKGTHRTWKLSRLAFEQALVEKSRLDCAT